MAFVATDDGRMVVRASSLGPKSSGCESSFRGNGVARPADVLELFAGGFFPVGSISRFSLFITPSKKTKGQVTFTCPSQPLRAARYSGPLPISLRYPRLARLPCNLIARLILLQ